MTQPEQGRRSFGDKLTYLIETVHPSDRGPYSYREIAARIAEHPGAMTAAHIHQLVKGKQPHPRIHHVEALASFFGVPVSYFFDDELPTRIDERMFRVGVRCDEQVRRIAELLVGLPVRDRDTVFTLIDNLRASDNRDSPETHPGT